MSSADARLLYNDWCKWNSRRVDPTTTSESFASWLRENLARITAACGPAPEREPGDDAEFKRNWKLMTEDLAFIRNLKATIETLETERDTWKRLCHQSDINRHALRDQLSKMNAEIAELRAERDEWREKALRLDGQHNMLERGGGGE